MAGFRFNVFKGIRPRISKRKLPTGEAQTAQNLKLGSGDLEAWPGNRTLQAVADPYVTRTIFLYEDTADDLFYWLQWGSYVDVARGPIKGDSLDRVYYTGDGSPKITWNALQTAPPYPSASYDLGVPKPLTRLQATGQALPESVAAANRRTSVDTPLAAPNFEIVSADFTEYPGTGTPNDTWRLDAAATGDIVFDLAVGDLLKVENVIDENTVVLGSATGTGAAAATAANDNSSVNYWNPMDEQGSTQTADFLGWRIPNNLKATITGHLLREGDIIRVTRLDLSYGLGWNVSLTTDLFELLNDGTAGDWGAPSLGVDGVYRHENVRLGASADGLTDHTINGGFYYDVDRTASDAATLEDRTYVYTFVSSIGEEGPPSNPSTLVSALDGDTVTLTGFDLAPIGARDIDRIRIYRTNATSIGTEYQFVREVELAQVQVDGSVTDTVPAADLGEIIATTTWFPPPADMQGIVSMPNGMMVGFRGKDLFFCEPYQPHAYPPEYDQAVDYEIVGLAPFGNSVAVLTKGHPYVITGAHPRNANVRPYKINQACLNKESIALANDKVYYAAPDGLVEIGINGARVVSEPYARRSDWLAFEPETMIGDFHDGQYYGFWGADDTVLPQPTGSVAASGTLVTDVETFEADIVAGAKTIILDLTDATWIGSAAFGTVQDDIIAAITSTGNEATGWNAVRGTIDATSAVVRSSDTRVTITLPALVAYEIEANEVLSFRAPAAATSVSNTLLAPETATVYPDSIYSTQVVVVSGIQTGTSVPEILVSDENIDSWIEIDAPAEADAADAPYLTDAAFHLSNDRWAAVGYNSAGPDADNCIVMTSDDVKDSAAWIQRSLPSIATDRHGRTIIYEYTTDSFFVGGESGLLMYSADGINWSQGNLPAELQDNNIIKFARAPNGGGGTSPRLYAIFEDTKEVAYSANLATSPLSTTWVNIGALTTTGTGMAACTAGNGRIYIANNNATAEVGYLIQGLTTYTKIGDLTIDVSDMVYGNGRLVVISANGRIQYADAPNEATIGNWSAVSSAIDGVGTRDLAKIEYDGGGNDRIGYGFIATLSASGAPGDYLVYTSPDAVTWTLRATQASTADALGIGTRRPQQDLSGTGGAEVTLTGWTQYSSDVVAQDVSLIVRADGTIDSRVGGNAPVQRFPLTNWIVPNYAVDPLYEFRVTNVLWLSGGTSDWATSPIADDSWIAMGSDRQWTINNALVRFDLEVRYNGGATITAATITLGSILFEDPRGIGDRLLF